MRKGVRYAEVLGAQVRRLPVWIAAKNVRLAATYHRNNEFGLEEGNA